MMHLHVVLTEWMLFAGENPTHCTTSLQLLLARYRLW